MDLGIRGRTALVCASSQGLGLACALALRQEGCHVVINGRDQQRLDRAVQTLQPVGDADATITAVAAEAQPLTSNRNITLQVIAPETEIMLSGSPELLHSALINLVENAIDFSPAGGRIEFRFVAPNRFQVTDEGPGIPEYAKPRLFERFYSLKQSQVGRRGTGLGLCFVKEAAELHGGSVSLENRADRTGAKAEMNIPAACGVGGAGGAAAPGQPPH